MRNKRMMTMTMMMMMRASQTDHWHWIVEHFWHALAQLTSASVPSSTVHKQTSNEGAWPTISRIAILLLHTALQHVQRIVYGNSAALRLWAGPSPKICCGAPLHIQLKIQQTVHHAAVIPKVIPLLRFILIQWCDHYGSIFNYFFTFSAIAAGP